MKVLRAMVLGIIAANAGFAAGFVGTIVVGPWTGTPFSAVAVGMIMGIIAMLTAFAVTLRSMKQLQYAVLLSH